MFRLENANIQESSTHQTKTKTFYEIGQEWAIFHQKYVTTCGIFERDLLIRLFKKYCWHLFF